MVTPDPGARRPQMVIWTACLVAAVLTSGVQGVVPAIPVIREQFGLTNVEVGLITGIYLFPGIFAAFGGGLVAQRIGSRSMVVGGLVVFGLGGALLMVSHDFVTLLAIRFVQGIVFGALLATTVSIIGAVVPAGPAAHRGQSRRIVSMAAAEAVFPVACGLLLAVTWYAPFALHILALPLAVVAWVVLPKGVEGGPTDGRSGRGPESVWKAPAIVGVQILAAARFVFKLAVLTYAPVLAVDQVGMSPALLGLLIGMCGAVSALTAFIPERIAPRMRSSEMILVCMGAIALSLVLLGTANAEWMIALGLLIFGAQDGIFGVAHNVLVNELTPAGSRSAYVGLTGSVRNVGKFVSPLAFAAGTLVMSISATFLVFAATTVVGAAAARSVIREQRAQDRRSAAGPERPPAQHD